jgi:hypothetical protein
MDVVPNKYLIKVEKKQDKLTYLGYTKKTLFENFENNIIKNDNDKTIYIFIDCLIHNYYENIWSCLFNLITKYININNPTLVIYLLNKYNRFNLLYNKYNNCGKKNYINNSQEIRNLLVEIISIFIYTRKSLLDDSLKLKKQDLEDYQKKIEYKSIIINSILLPNDNDTIINVCNEFAYNLIKFNYEKCVYWIEWLYLCEKVNKESIKCDIRETKNVNEEYYTDMIWLIWKIIIMVGENLQNNNIIKCLNGLFDLFIMKYNRKTCQDKKIIIYNCVKLLCFNNKYPIDLKKRMCHPKIACERQSSVIKNVMLINIKINEFIEKLNKINKDELKLNKDKQTINYFNNNNNNNYKEEYKPVIKREYYNFEKKNDNVYYINDNKYENKYDFNIKKNDNEINYDENANKYYVKHNDEKPYDVSKKKINDFYIDKKKQNYYEDVSNKKINDYYENNQDSSSQQSNSQESFEEDEEEENYEEDDETTLNKMAERENNPVTKSRIMSDKIKAMFKIIRTENPVLNYENKNSYNSRDTYEIKKISLQKHKNKKKNKEEDFDLDF